MSDTIVYGDPGKKKHSMQHWYTRNGVTTWRARCGRLKVQHRAEVPIDPDYLGDPDAPSCGACLRLIANDPPEGHVVEYRRFARGSEPISGRAVYGFRLYCECGWAMRVNEGDRRESDRWVKDHHDDVKRNT